jgi:precorrin-3B synthase
VICRTTALAEMARSKPGQDDEQAVSRPGATMIRGWCPGALRPMQSGDGLIVRLRIGGGIVAIGLAARIAQWSRRWGNGQIELTSRGNLQLRGLTDHHLMALHAALAEWDLLDPGVAGEAVRNVISSPLSGLDPTALLDVRPIARALEQRLSGDPALHALPGKFGFGIDDGGRLGLGEVAADIRFEARAGADGAEFAVGLGGAPHDLGRCRADALVETAAALCQVFLDAREGQETALRRMRDLVSARGADAIVREARLAPSGSPRSRPVRSAAFLGVQPLGSAAFVGAGLPFGRMAAEDLAGLAAAAGDAGARELRLTPWRAILVPVPSMDAARALSARLAAGAFILDPGDPRRRVAACPGAPACARGTTPVRDDASRLAALLAGVPSGPEILLHVSGCEKGCAHPRRAPVTLVARHGQYHLVRDGLASDPPVGRDLTPDEAADQVRRSVSDPLEDAAREPAPGWTADPARPVASHGVPPPAALILASHCPADVMPGLDAKSANMAAWTS